MATVANIGPSFEELQKLANDPELARRSLETLVLALNCDDDELSGWAAEALENMGPPRIEQATALIAWTGHSSILVACWGCKLVGRLEAQASPFQSELVRLVQRHDSLAVRQEAAAALSKIGKLTADTRAILTKAADGDDPRLKRLIAAALANSA